MNHLVIVVFFVCLGCLSASSTNSPNSSNSTESPVSKPRHYPAYFGDPKLELPMNAELQSTLEDGQTLILLGELSKDWSGRMNVNFVNGSELESNIPFHLSFRFQEPERKDSYRVVYNNQFNELWGVEETAINVFETGKKFDLRVRRLDGKFIVFMNRDKIKTFQEREGFDYTTHLAIHGKALAKLDFVYIGGAVYPQNPYASKMRLTPGRRVDISGIPDTDVFAINIYAADNKGIALHSKFMISSELIVRNSFLNNTWGREEVEGASPIRKGQVVDVSIVNDLEHFVIYVNGQHFCSYKQRTTYADIGSFELVGAFDIHSINVGPAIPLA